MPSYRTLGPVVWSSVGLWITFALALVGCASRSPADDQTPPDGVALDGGAPGTDGGDRDASAAPCSVGDAQVLVLHGGAIDRDHAFAIQARAVLREHRVRYDVHALGEDIAYERDGRGRYAAILVTDYEGYQALAATERATLDDYAARCDVGLYFLRVPRSASLVGGAVVSGASAELAAARVEASSPLLDLTRDGGVLEGAVPGRARTFELEPGAGFAPVAWAMTDQGEEAPWLVAGSAEDGIRRVLNGRDFEPFFLDELLLIDALAWLSPIELGELRERYVGVDIDDVFMPAYHEEIERRTVKLQAGDVPALLETQARISALIGADFRFALGFCAGYYGVQLGDPARYDDAAGDAELVRERAAFHWFDHLYRHTLVIDQTFDELAGHMEHARAWAAETGVIEHVGRYAVSPQHTGTSQRYAPLYEAWREVWGIRYSADTSDVGDGFEHLGVRVAPRVRANIWSYEYTFDQVSRDRLRELARGPIYREIIHRPVSIFMTHQGNYARDRIGNYLFEEVFAFIARWTRYAIQTGTPDELVEKHFELVPLEAESLTPAR